MTQRMLMLVLLVMVVGAPSVWAEPTPRDQFKAVRIDDCENAVATYLAAGCITMETRLEERCSGCATDFFMLCPKDIQKRVKVIFEPPTTTETYGYFGQCDPYTTWELVQ